MNIDKAIEILASFAGEPNKEVEPDLIDASKLGIEALKRIYLQRQHPKRKFNQLLSGETND